MCYMKNKREQTKNFTLPDSVDLIKISDELSKNYSTVHETRTKKKQMFYDTFDWRLYKNELILNKEKNSYKLRKLYSDQMIAESGVKPGISPKYWWEFPESELRNKLEIFTDIRALISLANVDSHTQTLSILNNDKKTVLRLMLLEIYIIEKRKKSKLNKIVELIPVRGYQREFSKVQKLLKQLGLTPNPQDILSSILEGVGRKPGDYTTKLTLKLEPETRSDLAVKKILTLLLKVIKQNENGIKADIDTEFLHDFRVAIRRTRSALTQVKGVFPQSITNKFKSDFSTLGRLTNRLRDLDVYLLKKEQYKQMLTKELCSGLDPVFEEIIKHRSLEHRRFVRFLGSVRYKEIINSWEDFLNSGSYNNEEAAKNDDKPIILLAKKFIWKKFNHVITIGEKINPSSPDIDLHRLRIECKKLRYLLEFFSFLFPEDIMTMIIKKLRRLQDNLGDFNDLYVQQEFLKKFLERPVSTGNEAANTTAAVGGLIAVLHQQQKQVRKEFDQSFNEINNPENSKQFKKLFSPKKV